MSDLLAAPIYWGFLKIEVLHHFKGLRVMPVGALPGGNDASL
jgi:hypothetical protein